MVEITRHKYATAHRKAAYSLRQVGGANFSINPKPFSSDFERKLDKSKGNSKGPTRSTPNLDQKF
jgi:hypothetical protein